MEWGGADVDWSGVERSGVGRGENGEEWSGVR